MRASRAVRSGYVSAGAGWCHDVGTSSPVAVRGSENAFLDPAPFASIITRTANQTWFPPARTAVVPHARRGCFVSSPAEPLNTRRGNEPIALSGVAAPSPVPRTGRRAGERSRPCGWFAALAVAAWAMLSWPDPVEAYIGPGAGFAIGTTFVTLFFTLGSAIGAFVFWPVRWALRAVRRRRAHARARFRRVVILGLDGLEPTLLERYLAEGKLPHFARLRDTGDYRRLATTAPAMTPVAWASFLTGCNPGKHRIFDFLTRDRRTYQPALSSVRIAPPRRTLKLGRRRIPLGRPEVRLLRQGRPFWRTLGEHGIFSNIIRMPITFPPEKFRGVLLAAMCVPDLRGSQGTFSYYSTAWAEVGETTGGERIRVEREGDRVRSHLLGPPNTTAEGGEPLRCPFEVRIEGPDRAALKVAGQTVPLRRGEYTPWVRIPFKAGWGVTVTGIAEFLLLEAAPEFRLYVTPIQIDPARPALPISHPPMYAPYFARLLGPYATLGMAEDTWALNEHVLDEGAFLHQCLEADRERIGMFFDALEKTPRGLCVCVVDSPDRVQHMFWRYLEPDHPANRNGNGRAFPTAIEDMYVRMDALVGDTLRACDDGETLVMVISDHGCASFRRGVDLNYWLEQSGYLALHPGGRGRKHLAGVDWSRTRAYAIGLAGIWLNLRGREAQGIVDPAEAAALRAEIAGRLSGLRDVDGATAVNRVLEAERIYRGPYKAEAPDLIVGYNRGYRVSWEAAVGQPTDRLFHDNTRAWSADHIVDPALVPGVLLCNRKLGGPAPHIADLAPTVLRAFGIAPPAYMDGRPLAIAAADGSFAEKVGPEPAGGPTG